MGVFSSADELLFKTLMRSKIQIILPFREKPVLLSNDLR